jgi:hypothetical protein
MTMTAPLALQNRESLIKVEKNLDLERNKRVKLKNIF